MIQMSDKKEPGDLGIKQDTLGLLFLGVYERLLAPREEFVRGVEKSLQQSMNPKSVEVYLSKSLALGLITGISLWLFMMFSTYVLYVMGIIPDQTIIGLPVPNEQLLEIIRMLRIPFIVLVTGLFFGTLGFSLVFGWFWLKPRMEVGDRKREINMLLPDALSFMYALSVGGLNQIEILEAIADADDTYGEVSTEFQSILQETNYLDTDYRTAISNHAEQTPSKEFSLFLSDMLSILSSGGDIESFLEDQKRKFMRSAKQEQEETLETLELFGEMYMTLSLFPLLLIIVMVIMGIMGESNPMHLYAVVYGLIPMISIGFIILISTVKQDEIGSGKLEIGDLATSKEESATIRAGHRADQYAEDTDYEDMFSRISKKEQNLRIKEILSNPQLFLKENPMYTLAITVPFTMLLLGLFVMQGIAPLTLDEMTSNVIWGTIVWIYIPAYVIFTPLMIFFEWNQHSRKGVVGYMSDTLRKLANANETGQTLFEAIATISDTSDTKLAQEFDVVHAKVEYGMTLREALVEFNNKYSLPRLARTIKLITTSSEASNDITKVLTTAAESSENQDDIVRERKSRARMQVAIIIMTYLTLLAVMAILQTQFIEVMSGLVDQAGGGGGGGGQQAGGDEFAADLDPEMLSMLFFHAVTIQAIMSGFISGYMRDAKLLSGLKFVVILQTISLIAWIMVV